MKFFCSQHGILPGTDITKALFDLFTVHPKDTEFVFEAGEYFFTPQFTYDYRLSNTDVLPERKLGIWMRGMENITLDFSGSTLYFAGQMQPFPLDHCMQVTVKDNLFVGPFSLQTYEVRDSVLVPLNKRRRPRWGRFYRQMA